MFHGSIAALFFVSVHSFVCFKMGSCYVAQTGLELWDSSNLPSSVAGTTSVHYGPS